MCELVITRDSDVIIFSPCVFVCVCLSMFVTMFVRTIQLWKTGATHTIYCRCIVGDVYLYKLFSHTHIVLASHPCTCVLQRQLSQLHTLKLPKFFHFHGDFHQNWYFAHPKISFAHPELPFLAKSMHTHDVIDDVARSQSRSHFVIAISILLYSTPDITSGKKVCVTSKLRPFWKLRIIKGSFILTSDM